MTAPSSKNVEFQGPDHMQIEMTDQCDTGEHIIKKWFVSECSNRHFLVKLWEAADYCIALSAVTGYYFPHS